MYVDICGYCLVHLLRGGHTQQWSVFISGPVLRGAQGTICGPRDQTMLGHMEDKCPDL